MGRRIRRAWVRRARGRAGITSNGREIPRPAMRVLTASPATGSSQAVTCEKGVLILKIQSE
ncbi:MAG: hypothetical protein RIS70_2478 [Planctomycetota bacterium]|jgi:hypothetical protein